MPEFTASLIITVRGPFVVKSTEPGAAGVDSPALTQTKPNGDRRLVLPGTEVKGRLVHAWRELAALAGDESSTNGGSDKAVGTALGGFEGPNLSDRGKFWISDLTGPTAKPNERTRIAIDPHRGAANEGALQVIEAQGASGESICFEGEMTLRCGRDEVDSLLAELRVASGLVSAFGAFRTIGFGTVENWTFGEAKATRRGHGSGQANGRTEQPSSDEVPSTTTDAGTADDILLLTLRPQSSFCLGLGPLKGNIVEGNEIIPGGAIKGTLAVGWTSSIGDAASDVTSGLGDDERRELAEQFSRLRFTHAFPMWEDDVNSRKARPEAVPFSVAQVPKKKPHGEVDLAGSSGVRMFADDRLPAFAPDWKGSFESDVRNRRGWASPSRELRTRTAIDAESRRAKAEQLFSLESVQPFGRRGGERAKVVWRAAVFFDAIEPESLRRRCREQLATLLGGGLRGLGKTKASVGVTTAPLVDDTLGSLPDSSSNTLVAVLQSDALMLDSYPDSDPISLNHLAARDASLRSAYEASWREALDDTDGKVSLERCFVRDALRGGKFRQARAGQVEGGYYPDLLTLAGSTFVFRIDGDASDIARVHDKLAKLRRRGLPLPKSVVQRLSSGTESNTTPASLPEPHELWRRCPWLPENGYGEVRFSEVPEEEGTPVKVIEPEDADV